MAENQNHCISFPDIVALIFFSLFVVCVKNLVHINGNTSHAHELVDLVHLIIPIAMYRFNVISTKFQQCFGRNLKTHPKIHAKSQGIPNEQNNIEKEEENWRHRTS